MEAIHQTIQQDEGSDEVAAFVILLVLRPGGQADPPMRAAPPCRTRSTLSKAQLFLRRAWH